MRLDEVIPDVGPLSALAGPNRSHAGRPKFRLCTPSRLALLLAAAIGMPWLPTFSPTPENPAMYRVRGQSDVPIRRFAISPDGRTVATSDDRGWVRLRPVAEGGGIDREIDVGGFGMAVAFSPDGRHLAIGRNEPDVVLCDLGPGGHGRLLGIPVVATSDLRFSPDGRTLAVSSYASREIILWDIEAGRPRMTLQGRSSPVATLAFAPDGRSLASAAHTEILLWDLGSGRPWHRLTGSSTCVPSLAYSPDSRVLAAVDVRENSVRILDVRTGGLVGRIVGHSRPIHSAAFSTDGRLLAVAASDGSASLSSFATGREFRRLDGQAKYLRHIAFSPDGRTMAATGDDDDIRLWDLDGLIVETADP